VGTVRALHVKEPTGAERTVALTAEPVVFGRDEDCTVQLDSPFVSRRHAQIHVGPDGVFLTDLGSHNGSFVNGQRTTGPAVLTEGDVVALGDVTIECLAGARRMIKTRTLVRPVLADPGQAASPAASPAQREPAEAVRQPDERLRIDPRTLYVWVGGRQLERRLSAQEFKLLAYLHDHQDRICTRRELGDAIWGRHTWDPNLLYRLVRRVKEKIEPDPKHPRYLQTIPWVGYRLTP
jgi:pSer/pThr/pTyr-binding forkhead associated (FHA) protein